MKLIPLSSFLVCAALALGVGAAQAAKKEKEKDREQEASAKPEKLGTFGDWSVFHSGAGKAKLCYVLAEPKTREPQDDKDTKAYAFISERPAEKVRNEISFVMGFEVATGSAPAESKDRKKSKKSRKDDEAAAPPSPTAAVGDEEFDLIPRGNDLWVKNPAEEGKVIEEMRKGASLVIKVGSKRGRQATDTYSLSGFSQAVDKALKDCPPL
jgi:invasion protein IalB